VLGNWRVRLPLYAAGLAAGGAFSVLFTGGALPYMLGAALVAIIVGSAGTYRFVLLFPVVALYVLFAVYGTLPLSLGGWRELFERIGQDVYETARITYANPVPYDVHPGLFMVLIPIVMIVVAFATSATLYEGSPVVSVAVLGLAIGAVSTASFETGIEPFFALFLVSSIALLLLTDDGMGRGESFRPAAVSAGALILALVLALPLIPFAKEALRPALIDWTRLGTSSISRLAVEADVGDYLTTGRNTELMRVKSPEPLFWRGGTLDHFDGVRWSSTVRTGEDDGEEVAADVPTRDEVQRVEILKAETSVLFGGYRISGVSVPYAQELSDGSWTSPRPLTEDSSYQVLSQIPQPTTAQLEAAASNYPEAVREKFLQLPENRPEVLPKTAEKIKDDYNPQTPYEAARAIERYLIRDGGFTYSLDANYNRGDKAIEKFLGEDRKGFCTQFATSMVLLTRELGVPSRLVYGATAGKEVEPDQYLVTGSNMHTWVEVYFPEIGWYPFEPTPGFSIPSAMEANAPRPDPLISQVGVLPESPSTIETQQPSEPAPEKEETPTEAREDAASPEPAIAPYAYVLSPMLLLALLVAAIPLIKKVLVVRGRPDDFYQDLTGRLRDILSLNGARATIADSPALTPTERLLLLADLAGVEAKPFREFARVYSESLYAPDPHLNAMHTYRRAVREYEKLPRWKRALGAFNPASLLLRGRWALTACRTRFGKTLRKRKRLKSSEKVRK
jgi:transglutaminase-like putative cysteine protease